MAKRTIFEPAVLIAAIFIPVQALSAQQITETKPRLALKVVDYAKVDPTTFEEAKQVALRVLARAGIGIILLDPDFSVSAPEGIATFYVNIHEKAALSGFPADTLGVAPGTAKDRNRYMVYVFDHPANRLLEQLGAGDKSIIDKATILGYAMAHEIGHVLLHLTGHSPSGVMKANWTVEDMKKMSTCWVNFDSGQAAKMQAEIKRRTRDRQTTMIAPLP